MKLKADNKRNLTLYGNGNFPWVWQRYLQQIQRHRIWKIGLYEGRDEEVIVNWTLSILEFLSDGLQIVHVIRAGSVTQLTADESVESVEAPRVPYDILQSSRTKG